MTIRFNIGKETPELYGALMTLNAAISNTGIDKRLVHLVKIRTSQINGCAFCVDMHVKEAIEDGVEEKVLHLLPVWQETSAFSSREKAALAWAEAVTLVTESRVSDAIYEAARVEFSELELAELTVAIGAMNLWNRIGVSARMPA